MEGIVFQKNLKNVSFLQMIFKKKSNSFVDSQGSRNGTKTHISIPPQLNQLSSC